MIHIVKNIYEAAFKYGFLPTSHVKKGLKEHNIEVIADKLHIIKKK